MTHSQRDRQSIRWSAFDYSKRGLYFVTLCTHDKQPLFGEIKNTTVHLSKAGLMAYREWLNTPTLRSNVRLGMFVIMPNHIHGIIEIVYRMEPKIRYIDHGGGVIDGNNADRLGIDAINTDHFGIDRSQSLQKSDTLDANHCHQFGPQSNNLFAIIRGFKSAVTVKINRENDNNGGQVWQPRFHDHVIRNQEALQKIERYIAYNPHNWSEDLENKTHQKYLSAKNRNTMLRQHYESICRD